MSRRTPARVRRQRLLVASLLVAFYVGLAVILAPLAQAHWRPGYHNQDHAITFAFCGGSFRPCRWGEQAKVVAGLESSGCVPRDCDSRDLYRQGRCAVARNGQYQGCFQMGEDERRRYGHGLGVWDQALAANRYFVASGRDWSPWACKPWGYCER